MQLTVQTPQVLGHSFMTARGLRSHSPLSCQMAHWVSFLSRHWPISHTPHDEGHLWYMNCALLKHSPCAAQPAHCFLVSLQSGVHTPHAIGHSLYIISGFSSHWPSCAHATHDSAVSVQLKVHTPHESGQREVIESGFFSHSPSRAQLPQSVLMSLHTPAAARARLKTKTDRLSIMVRQRSIVGGREQSARRGHC